MVCLTNRKTAPAEHQQLIGVLLKHRSTKVSDYGNFSSLLAPASRACVVQPVPCVYLVVATELVLLSMRCSALQAVVLSGATEWLTF